MHRVSLGISIISFNTLMVELLLTRVFDVILHPHLAYMIITCAMFSFGLAGIYGVLRPLPPDKDVSEFVSKLAILFSLSTLFLLPILNALPFDWDKIGESPFFQLIAFLAMYLALMLPFFFSGLIFTTLFSAYSGRIQNLYFWDLAGGALGCVVLIPFLPKIGPGGLLFVSAGLTLVAAASFSHRPAGSRAMLVLAVLFIVVPFSVNPAHIDFRLHWDKRKLKTAIAGGLVEFSRWDPISRIDVVDQPSLSRKHIAFDGGSQSSYFYPFDGDYQYLRNNLDELDRKAFWFRGVLVSHYLKRDTGSKVLIIGSAGGQETRAALMYGAGRVDAVEMVGTVVDLGKRAYSQYNGNIFNHPSVRAISGEGRSFLRQSTEKYDVIQIFSNHNSSSIAAGTGAMLTAYLQTVEAYQEYFSHLSEDGILHINHHVYPRMVATAARGWKMMGRSDFRNHVIVIERQLGQDNLPTVLIKTTPWTEEEVTDLINFLNVPYPRKEDRFVIVENPLNPGGGFLSDEFYAGEFSERLVERMDYRVRPPTDDSPFFNFFRKRLMKLDPDPENFLDRSTAAILNASLKRNIVPMDIMHLVVTALASLFYAVIFIVVPIYYSDAGGIPWRGKGLVLTYFSCLGAGFIIFELVFIQIFMKLVGYPLYTYSTVIFTMLFSAGIGSYCSGFLVNRKTNRWYLPFVGILLTAVAIWWAHPSIFNVFLATSTPVRVSVAAGMIFPLGFFLGMPFPLGILKIETKPRGAIAWAWGMNGLLTIVGGLTSVVLSLILGFRMTLVVAMALYLLAFWSFSRLSIAAENE